MLQRLRSLKFSDMLAVL